MTKTDMNDRPKQSVTIKLDPDEGEVPATIEAGMPDVTREATGLALQMHGRGLTDVGLASYLAEIARDPAGTLEHLHRIAQDQEMEPLWLHGGCPGWCVEEHHERDRRQDRFHVSVFTDRLLSLHDPVEVSDGSREWWEPELVRMYLRQHVTAAEPTVCLFRGETVDGLEMTLEEAHGIGEHLTELAEQGRPAPRRATAAHAVRQAEGAAVCHRDWCELVGRPIGEEPSRVLGEWNPLGLHEEHRRALGTVGVAEGTHEHDPVTVSVRVQAWLDEPARIEVRHDVDGQVMHDDALFLAHDEAARLAEVLADAARRADR